MPSIPTNATDDICSEVACLGAIILTVTNLATVLASLVLIVTQRAVQGGEFAELVALELVLAFRDRGGLLNVSKQYHKIGWDDYTYRLDDVVNQLLGLVDFLLGVCHDQAVQIFVLIAGMSSVRFSLSFFHRALAANCDLGTRLRLHLLQSIATWSDEEADC